MSLYADTFRSGPHSMDFGDVEVIDRPCPTYESRSIGRINYGSHAVALAKGRYGDHYVLMEHGGGREKIRIHDRAAEIAMTVDDEQKRYLLLYEFAHLAREAAYHATRATAQKYAEAFIDGRLKKSRARRGVRTVSIEPKAAEAPATLLLAG